MKIAIIGNAGSGKSTLGLHLHKITNLPLYHLDRHFWLPGWVQPDRSQFEKIHNELCEREQWIIEGQSIRFFEYRLKHADLVIYLDYPRYLTFYRVFKRMIKDYGIVRSSSAPGCPEKLPSFKFLHYMWQFATKQRPFIYDLFEKYPDKEIVVVKNQKQLSDVVDLFKKKKL